MLIFDIIVAFVLLWALWAGFRDGIAVQLGGLAGLFAGVWLASRFAAAVGALTGLDPGIATPVGFVIVVVATLLAMFVIGRALRGLFRIAGLGVIDKLGGGLLSLLKVGLVCCALVWAFDSLNRSEGWVDAGRLSGSRLYRPMKETARYAFPYLDTVKEHLLAD